jgi:hypothetical protein
MRRRLAATVAVALTACAPMPEQKHRWPNHRQDHDSALGALQKQNLELQARVEKLERAVDVLRHVITQRAELSPAAAAPAQLDSGNAPTSPP